MKTPTTVELEMEDNIALVWLDGEVNRNALSLSTMRELDSMLHGLEKNRDLAVVLIRGRGPSFCAGFDLGPVVDDPSRWYPDAWCAPSLDNVSRLPGRFCSP